jgi:hypothetical protein
MKDGEDFRCCKMMCPPFHLQFLNSDFKSFNEPYIISGLSVTLKLSAQQNLCLNNNIACAGGCIRSPDLVCICLFRSPSW